jgi:iron complex outermembrane receptor protein
LLALFNQQQALGVRTALPIDNDDQSSGRNFLLSNISTADLSEAMKLRNIVGYDSSRLTFQQDNDGTAFNIAAAPYYPTTQLSHQVTEEAQLLGQSFAKRLDWIVGAFYLDQPDRDYYRSTTFLFNGLSDSDTLAAFGTKSQALFGQATYDLSALAPGLKLTGGLRYTWDDLSNANLGPAPGSPGLGPPYGGEPGPKSFCGSPPINCSTLTATDVKSSALTWTGGVDYQATTDTLLYFTSRRGYRAGGSNGLNAAGELYPSYGPEYVVDFEIGAKSDWNVAGMPIRTDADLYYDNYTGIQANQQTYINDVLSNIVTNSGKGRIWGAELEAQINVTNDLQLGVNFDYLNFAYTSFEPGVSPATVVGTRTSDRPPYKYSVDARYHLPLPTDAGNVAIRAIWTWQAALNQTGTSLVPSLPPGADINAFGLLNLSADWDRIRGSNLDTSFFMSNALDKTYSIGGFGYYNNLGFSVQRYGEPRMYGIRLRYHFGAQ